MEGWKDEKIEREWLSAILSEPGFPGFQDFQDYFFPCGYAADAHFSLLGRIADG